MKKEARRFAADLENRGVLYSCALSTFPQCGTRAVPLLQAGGAWCRCSGMGLGGPQQRAPPSSFSPGEHSRGISAPCHLWSNPGSKPVFQRSCSNLQMPWSMQAIGISGRGHRCQEDLSSSLGLRHDKKVQ